MNSHESMPAAARQSIERSTAKRVWQAPTIQPLGVGSTETVTFKWFTPDQHIVTADYGTPAS